MLTDDYKFDEAIFNEQLQCFVYKLEYNFKLKLGILIMANGSCCDMTECINLFKKIDPKVIQIQTFAGNKRDTTYSLHVNNEWVAIKIK